MGDQLLICTLGNREIYLDGRNLDANRFRSECQRLLSEARENPATLDLVDAPRLRACLSYIQLHGRDRLDAIYLVVTDRNPNPAFVERDTKEAGELLQLWLEREKLEREKKVRTEMRALLGQAKVRLMVVKDREPNEYGQVYDALAPHFERLPPAGQVDIAWLYPMPGTPAMTMAVILHSLARWRERVRVLIVPEKREQAEESPFPTAFLRQMRKELLIGRLEGYDWTGCLALAPEMGPLRLVLASALARSRFEFREAIRNLDNALAQVPDANLRMQLRGLRDGLNALLESPTTPDSRPHLAEVLFNARMCWRAGRYIDFLGRMYRLEEGLLRYWLERLGFPTDDSPSERARSRSAFWRRVEELGLVDKLRSSFDVQVGGPLNRSAFHSVLQALLDGEMTGELEGELREYLPLVAGPLRELSQLRNRTILGHGFAPVDPEAVRQAISQYLGDVGAGADPVEALMDRLTTLLGPGMPDPYQRLREVAQRLLESS